MKQRMNVNELKSRIAASEKEIADLTSRLVRFKTVNPPGYTDECVRFIESFFREYGIPTRVYEPEEGKANISASVLGKRPGKVLWLGHLDVVPEGSLELWQHDPFGGEQEEGRVFGRGSCDMKGACAAAMVAAKNLAKLSEESHVNAEFWFTCDEETAAINGAQWLAKTGRFTGDLCVIGDSFLGSLTSPSIDIGCKGAVRPRLKARGRTAHGSQPYLGDNAIEKLLTALHYVRKVGDYQLDLPAELGPVLASSTSLLLQEPGLTEAQKASIRKLYWQPSVSLNILQGGVKNNVVPDSAEAVLDIQTETLRGVPGTDRLMAAFPQTLGALAEDPLADLEDLAVSVTGLGTQQVQAVLL
ncbi:MAG: M20/M25/M40 family metallo-hydrolase, partial [Candidatus Bathyarchaeia archaeon]